MASRSLEIDSALRCLRGRHAVLTLVAVIVKDRGSWRCSHGRPCDQIATCARGFRVVRSNDSAIARFNSVSSAWKNENGARRPPANGSRNSVLSTPDRRCRDVPETYELIVWTVVNREESITGRGRNAGAGAPFASPAPQARQVSATARCRRRSPCVCPGYGRRPRASLP